MSKYTTALVATVLAIGICTESATAALISSFTVTNSTTGGPGYPAGNPLGISVISPLVDGGPPVVQTAQISVALQSVTANRPASLDAAIIGGGTLGTSFDLSVDAPSLASPSYPASTTFNVRLHFAAGAGQQPGALSVSSPLASAPGTMQFQLGWTIPDLGRLAIDFDGIIYGNNPITFSNVGLAAVDAQTQDLSFTLNSTGAATDSEVVGFVIKDIFVPPPVPLPAAFCPGAATVAILVMLAGVSKRAVH